ncbi:hypothetical protein ES707_04608 [subsurface metagenome]
MRKKIAILGLILILGMGKLVMAQVWEEIRPSDDLPVGALPDERNGHVLIQQFVFGGFDQDNDLWILREEGGGNWRWEYVVAKGTAPSSRGGHSGIFVYEELGQGIIIFGGSESSLGVPVDSDTYKLPNPWEPSPTWEKLETTGTVPSARAEHTAVYDTMNNRMIVFGGYTSTGSPVAVSSETYTLDFDVAVASWTKLNTTGDIPICYGHSAVWGGMGMMVFGGKDNSEELLNDCWRLEGSNWTEINVTGDKPTARWQHTAVWVGGSPGEGGMLIFGGKDEQGNLNDLWFLQEPVFPEPWKWEKIYPIGDSPSARSGHAAALGWGGEGGEKMFIFGGSGKNDDLNDVYAFAKAEKVKETLREKPFNAPNPFNPDREETKICYYLDDDENVKIKLFTLTGDLVYSWENISGREGLNQESWDGRNEKGRIVENGGYICLIEAGGKKQKCKIAVLRFR